MESEEAVQPRDAARNIAGIVLLAAFLVVLAFPYLCLVYFGPFWSFAMLSPTYLLGLLTGVTGIAMSFGLLFRSGSQVIRRGVIPAFLLLHLDCVVSIAQSAYLICHYPGLHSLPPETNRFLLIAVVTNCALLLLIVCFLILFPVVCGVFLREMEPRRVGSD